MAQRRLEDRVATQVFVPTTAGLPKGSGIGEAVARAPRELHSFRLPAGRTDFVAWPDADSPSDSLSAIFAIGVSGDGVLVVSGDEQVLLPLAADGESSASRLAAAVTAVRHARARTLRQCASRNAFLLLSERLSRAECEKEVIDALLEQTHFVVEGYGVALAFRLADEAQSSPFAWYSALDSPDGSLASLPPLPSDAARSFSFSGTVIPENCSADECPAAIVRIFEVTGAAKLAFVGLGALGTLFLVERRPERRFDADDWHLLTVVARQAEDAMIRLRRT